MISTLSPTDFAQLYRFSVALAGINEEAEHLVHTVLEEKIGPLADIESHKSVIVLLRSVWESRPEPRGDTPISNLPPQFQWMKTRDRAVAILQGFARFSEQEIAAICGKSESDEASAMPPDKIAAVLESIPVSPELLKRFAVTVQGAHPPFRLLSSLGLSLVFAALVSLAVAGWIWRDWHSQADEILAQKFIDAIEKTSLDKLEPVDAPVGDLADVLFLKYGLENFPLPASFGRVPAAMLGLNQVDGHPVVQIGLKNSRALLMLFRAEDFGLDPNADEWQTANIDGWSLAIRSQNQQGHVVTLFGSEDELRALLPK